MQMCRMDMEYNNRQMELDMKATILSLVFKYSLNSKLNLNDKSLLKIDGFL